jgi:hypothetical protein
VVTHAHGFQGKVRDTLAAFGLLIAFAHAMVRLVACQLIVALNRLPFDGDTWASTARLPLIAAPSPWRRRSSGESRVGNNSSLEEPR